MTDDDPTIEPFRRTDYIDEFDRVTARDIADFLDHHATLRCADPGGDDPTARAAFLHRKADLFTRIADQEARIRVDAYVEQVRHMAADARAAAHRAVLHLPQQRVEPTPSATPPPEPDPTGARSQKNPGASSG